MRCIWKILSSETAQKINLKKIILMTNSETCSPLKFHPAQPFLLACFFFEDEQGSVGQKGSQGQKGQKGMPGTCDDLVWKDVMDRNHHLKV